MHPHENARKIESLQKKFLDSFALISSTSAKSGETASAVCMEQGHPTGTVLRLARNLGVPQQLLQRLNDVLDDLAAASSTELPTQEKEHQLLLKIVDLTRLRIESILQRLRDPKAQRCTKGVADNLRKDAVLSDDPEKAGFATWMERLPVLMSLEPNAESTVLVPHIKWASRAKWVYSEHLEALFCQGEEELPDWVFQIYKLGRYFAAAKAMIKLAIKQPSLFTSIHIEVIDAPDQERFTLGNDLAALKTVIQKLTNVDHDKLMSQLGQIWLTGDPELRFRQACRLTLTVHAEMQILSFYDHHPELTPRLAFMGTSKKTCFLCHRFMSRHPLQMSASASHQKLYPSWMPAPCFISDVRKRNKTLLWELSRHLEDTTARDLETRLGIRRRKNLDSTAGPSLTTSGSIASDWWTSGLANPNNILDLSPSV
ncbi:hypothetical protein FPRO05_12074 [Fusarium proliferatum]|uniref:Uncharacterized protein n=1 Tax=Gibberella intermedia TaxID=948311 RepID=A0A365N4W4_GIBIN|nr:hypothetical protein FPRO05_12074 [Fusarium proliferatum]